MDLGRPVARHSIRRPHEVLDLDLDLETELEEPAAEDKQFSSETPER